MDNIYLYIGLGVAVVIIVGIVLSRGSTTIDFSETCGSGNITEQKIIDLVQSGRKIEAIKLYRAMHKVGLKEAKDAVDKMAE